MGRCPSDLGLSLFIGTSPVSFTGLWSIARRARGWATVRSVSTRTLPPNVHPACANVPGIGEDGFEELCHLVEDDPDTALCGQDVSGYPWNPPWPMCEACVAIATGRVN